MSSYQEIPKFRICVYHEIGLLTQQLEVSTWPHLLSYPRWFGVSVHAPCGAGAMLHLGFLAASILLVPVTNLAPVACSCLCL